jgi:hypothetical protein
MSLDRDTKLLADEQWHRGLRFTNLFRGTINSYGTVAGEWADVTRGGSLNRGTLTIRFGAVGGEIQFSRVAETGNFGATTWHKTDALDDTKFNGVTTDIISRFDQVHKNDDKTLDDNLKPYRDQTVLYGRLTDIHLDYLKNNCLESEIPHVNYGPPVAPRIPQAGAEQCDDPSPQVLNFGQQARDFDSFVCAGGDNDADFDLRMDVYGLETDFYTIG